MKKFVWVVEIRFKKSKVWNPCADCWLTKLEANRALDKWRTGNPDDDFRITKYFRP